MLEKYQRFAKSTMNPATVDRRDVLQNCALGIAGEAGEVCDGIKKVLYQGRDVSDEHLVEELGDLLWYISNMATELGYTLEDVLQRNIEKLEARYPGGFSYEHARQLDKKD